MRFLLVIGVLAFIASASFAYYLPGFQGPPGLPGLNGNPLPPPGFPDKLFHYGPPELRGLNGIPDFHRLPGPKDVIGNQGFRPIDFPVNPGQLGLNGFLGNQGSYLPPGLNGFLDPQGPSSNGAGQNDESVQDSNDGAANA